MNLNLEGKVTLHNRFHLVLEDAEGNVKQEGFAENIILQNFWNWMINGTNITTAWNSSTGRFGYTWLGSGTGTLDVGRTNLFTHLDRQSHSYYTRTQDWEDRWGSVTFRYQWSELMLQNTTITEVGLGGSAAGQLSTHALIQDSEGNPISIEKGTLDILTVYSTVFMVFGDSFCGNANLDFVRAHPSGDVAISDNTLYGQLHGQGTERWTSSLGLGWQITVGYSRVPLNRLVPMGAETGQGCIYFTTSAPTEDNRYQGASAIGIDKDNGCRRPLWAKWANFNLVDADLVYNPSGKNISFKRRFGVGDANTAYGLSEVGVSMTMKCASGASGLPLFNAVLPISGVWPGYSVTGEEVATGDAAETEFNLKWREFDPASLKVYVDTVLQVLGTDYTIIQSNGPLMITDKFAHTIEALPGDVAPYGFVGKLLLSGMTPTATFCRAAWSELTISGSTYTGTQPQAIIVAEDSHEITQLSLYNVATSTGGRPRAFEFSGRNLSEDAWTLLVDSELPSSVGWSHFDLSSPVNYKQYHLRIKTSWGTSASCILGQMWLRDMRKNIAFTSPPADGAAITADYDIDYIPKDINHVLDIGFTIQFSDANA